MQTDVVPVGNDQVLALTMSTIVRCIWTLFAHSELSPLYCVSFLPLSLPSGHLVVCSYERCHCLQMQHLELTRDIAERMNTKYGGSKWKKLGGRGGRIFKVPDAFIAPVGARVMSLTVRSQPSRSSSPPSTLCIPCQVVPVCKLFM